MKDDIRQIIDELHSASRQPLFNAIAGSPDDASVGKTSLSHPEVAGSSSPSALQNISMPASKRPRRETLYPTMKSGSWDTVSFVHHFLMFISIIDGSYFSFIAHLIFVLFLFAS